MCKERSADTKEEINPGKESNTVNTTSDIERYCTIQESITQSFKEIKLISEDMLPKKTWNDYLKEHNNEDTKGK